MGISLLRFDAVLQRTGFSRRELYRRIAAGNFPKSITITGSRFPVWPSTTIDAWVQSQIDAAQQGRNINEDA